MGKEYEEIVKTILNTSGDELEKIWDEMSYHGYDREKIMKSVIGRYKLKKIEILAFATAVALRGPKKAESIVFESLDNTSLIAKKIVRRSKLSKWDVTPSRLCCAFADIAAWMMKKFDVPKRLDHNLPGWLQFPAAACIKLPEKYRRLHRDWSEKFSLVIGGKFREDLYNLMVDNAFDANSGLELWSE